MEINKALLEPGFRSPLAQHCFEQLRSFQAKEIKYSVFCHNIALKAMDVLSYYGAQRKIRLPEELEEFRDMPEKDRLKFGIDERINFKGELDRIGKINRDVQKQNRSNKYFLEWLVKVFRYKSFKNDLAVARIEKMLGEF